MEELVNKFIEQGKREHEEMDAFIKEFRTTNKLFLKERNNSLSELEFEVYRLSRAINKAQMVGCEAKGVTTRGGKSTTEPIGNNINTNKHPLRKEKEEAQQRKFLENLKQLHINIRFIKALAQMPKYAKFLKGLLSNKARLEEACTVTMNERCSAVLLNKFPSKEKDPGSFTIPCDIGHLHINNALADLGAKDVLIKIDKFILLIDFVILDTREDSRIPIILGRPFQATARAIIDVFNKKITLRVGSEEVIFDVNQSMKKPHTEDDECYRIDDLDIVIQSAAQELLENDHRNKNLEDGINRPDFENHVSNSEIPIWRIDHINTPYSQETKNKKKRRTSISISLVVLPNLNRTRRLREDNFYLSLWDFCLQEDAVQIMQRSDKFIKDFSMISKPMTQLLMKDAKFNFSEDCKKTFNKVKGRLNTAPIVISPYWSIPFELMCDASDFAVGAVLGQRIDGNFKPIYYASKTLNNAQANYTTIEKELLAVVFSFDKFRPYLILSKTMVYTDHSALKYLFSKQDAKPRLIRWVLLLQGFNIKIKDKKGQKTWLLIIY
ncbi:reverse transcriptase domain-containing protein [Tanacetum coccineum]